ncbi:MAG TPA: hypothetical protein VGQ00_00675 [Candidatus Norongarragalinales archaeon]|jgi:hypothetical protein|nr:hypothetical protein [Candidatus Norongarragalinales archaeon]
MTGKMNPAVKLARKEWRVGGRVVSKTGKAIKKTIIRPRKRKNQIKGVVKGAKRAVSRAKRVAKAAAGWKKK